MTVHDMKSKDLKYDTPDHIYVTVNANHLGHACMHTCIHT